MKFERNNLSQGRGCIMSLLWAAIVLTFFAGNPLEAQTAMVSVHPDADAFVRSQAPASNYGGGGALSVSGSAAVNGSGVQSGLLDSLMRFPMSDAVPAFNDALGGPDWIVTEARLVVSEMAAPDSDFFNQGIGTFEVRWIANDGWIEGTGRPIGPTSDGVAWQDVPLILNSNLDVALGVFTNSGANAQVAFFLGLAESFIQDLRQGGEVGFYLTARSPTIGFTFNSRNFGNTNAQPVLVVKAMANPRPQINSIATSGTNVTVGFGTLSNWTYVVQCVDGLASGGIGWSNLVTVPAQLTNGHAVLVDGVTNRQRFYRLSVSQ